MDGAINGFGGCPMAEDKLVGNVATETIIDCLEKRNIAHGLDLRAFSKAVHLAGTFFKQ